MRFFSAAFAAAALLLQTQAFSQEASKYDVLKDPRYYQENYSGEGYAEEEPDYAEAKFTFTVDCQPSAQAVYDELKKVTGPIWKDITDFVPEKSTETEIRYWGDVEKIAPPQPDSATQIIEAVYDKDRKLVSSKKTIRVSKCEVEADGKTKKSIPLDSKVGQVFSGSQTFGLRSDKLVRLEKVVDTVQKLPQSDSPKAVKSKVLNLDPKFKISYRVTQETAEKMKDKIKEQAEKDALGPDSDYASDGKNLGLGSRYFLNERFVPYSISRIPPQAVPVEEGKAPQMRLELPFIYSIYGDAGDVINPASPLGAVALTKDFQVSGRGEAPADYAELSVTVSAECATDKASSEKAIHDLSLEVIKALKAFNADKNTETDRVEVQPANLGEEQTFSLEPTKWSETIPPKELEYWDACARTTIAAPQDGQAVKVPAYFRATQEVVLRTSEFETFAPKVKEWNEKYGVSKDDPKAARVVFSAPVGQVKKSTLAKLYSQARSTATACVLDPDGALAKSVTAEPDPLLPKSKPTLRCAHFKSLRLEPAMSAPRGGLGLESARSMGLKSFATNADAAAPGGSSEEVDELVQLKDELRPKVKKRGTWTFSYWQLSDDYVQSLKAKKTAGAKP